MRFALLVAILFLAGCSGPASDGDDPGGSAVGTPAAPQRPVAKTYQNQTLGSFDVNVVMGMPASFDVEVPDHAIDVTVAPAFIAAAMVGLHVAIAECGVADFPGVTASAAGTLGTAVACAGGSPGSHAVTVSVDAGVFVGTITVSAMVTSE